jgi:alcohol dehydrogenase class IV
MTFVYDALPGRVVFGAGTARTHLLDQLDLLSADRVLLCVTGRGRAQAEAIIAPIASRISATFTDVRMHVPVETAEAARSLALESGAQAVLSIGGGSATGTAKAVALTTGLPIVAVPTTYAGSEVTAVWGMTEGQRKTTGKDLRVLPKVVVYDAELTLDLPVGLSAASGLNALAHCVEAFWGPGSNPITSLVAEEGIRALVRGLPAVVAETGQLAARSDVLYGAYLAGASFAVAGSSLHHKICHVLGGAFDLPHAQMHAVVLPHVLALVGPALPEVEARIAAALGARAGGAVAALSEHAVGLGAPTALRDIGMREEDLETATDLVLEKLPADAPVILDRDGVAELLAAAWRGAPRLA